MSSSVQRYAVAQVFVNGMWPDEDEDEGTDLGNAWFIDIPRPGETFYLRPQITGYRTINEARLRVISTEQHADTWTMENNPHTWVLLRCVAFNAEELENLRILFPQSA